MTTVDESRPTEPSTPAVPDAPETPPARYVLVGLGAVAALALGVAIAATGGATNTALYAIGLAFGLVLFHSRFGFTSAWRQLVSVGQGAALRAHMVMLGAAVILFAPILAFGLTASDQVDPSVAPLGLSVVVGSLLFGVGMQLGGSCASGTLFAVGSGQTAIVITLGGFIAGSVIGAAHVPFWTQDGLTGPAVSLADSRLGPWGALAVSLLAMGLIAWLTFIIARRRNPPRLDRPPRARGLARVVRGSWPLGVGAVLLAGLNALTLWLSGSAWGITSAFALWGSKALGLIGVDVSGWEYWSTPDRAGALDASVLTHKTSVMDFGIILGALMASAAAGAFVLRRRVPWRLAVGAIIGGLLMGYGARIAYGCNIGAYFSGIASFSLHGWLWGAVAIVGTFAGLALRPLFGLTNPKPTDSRC